MDIKGEIARYRAGLASAPVAGFMVMYNKHSLSLEDLGTLEEQNWINDQVKRAEEATEKVALLIRKFLFTKKELNPELLCCNFPLCLSDYQHVWRADHGENPTQGKRGRVFPFNHSSHSHTDRVINDSFMILSGSFFQQFFPQAAGC